MTNDESFPKKFRLRGQLEFDAVFQNNCYSADDVLVVQAKKNGLEYSRLGLSIGRKVGNAVQRNRWKRVIRECFRKQRRQLPSGLDIIVRPRKGAVCESASVARSLPRLLNRISRKLGIDQASRSNSVSRGSK